MSTYGEAMTPLDVDQFLSGLPGEQQTDPLVREFVVLSDATSRAEKISDPDTWTPKERQAYAEGDTVKFSTLRGYTPAEISQFLRYIDCALAVDAKYGPDTAICICFEISCVTGPD